MRIGCSKLKFDLCYNLHVIDDPLCSCGATESAKHFFMDCPTYVDLRIELFNVISIFTSVSIKTLLEGCSHLSTIQNRIIFDAVFNYIEKSKRFV